MPKLPRADGAFAGCRKCQAPPRHSQVSPRYAFVPPPSANPPNSTAVSRAVSKASGATRRAGGVAVCHAVPSHSQVSPRGPPSKPPNMTVRARPKSYASAASMRPGSASAFAEGTWVHVDPSQLHRPVVFESKNLDCTSRVRDAAKSNAIAAPGTLPGGCVGGATAVHAKPSNSQVREESSGVPPHMTTRLRGRSYAIACATRAGGLNASWRWVQSIPSHSHVSLVRPPNITVRPVNHAWAIA